MTIYKAILFLALVSGSSFCQSIRLETPAGYAISDTINMLKGDSITLIAVFYNAGGTKISPLPVTWVTTGNLSFPDTSRDTVTITTSQISVNESGILYPVSLDNSFRTDTVCVRISVPVILLDARTRDLNSNGLLDAIDLIYENPVSLPTPAECLVVQSSRLTQYFPVVDSCLYFTTDHKNVRLLIAETNDDSAKQCAWEPRVTITNMGDYMCRDGIPPKIRQVSRTIRDSLQNDLLWIRFNERIEPWSSSGSALFTLWNGSQEIPTFNPGFSFMPAETSFFAISPFPPSISDRSSIAPQDSSIVDLRYNMASLQPVRVLLLSDHNVRLRAPKAMINPANLSSLQASFQFTNDDSAYQKYTQGKGLYFEAIVRTPADGKAVATLRIFNVVNKTEFQAVNNDFLSGLNWPRPGELTQINIFWNGQGDNGSSIEPGGYGARLTVSYSSGEYATATDSLAFVFGDPVEAQNNIDALIAEANKKGCGCGSGVGLAFIPPFMFKANNLFRRKKSKGARPS